MRCVRNPDGQVLVLDNEGRPLAELLPVEADEAAFDAVAQRMVAAFGTAPRVAVRYREGLLDDAQADAPCELLLIEEDPFDDPPCVLRRRPLPGDAAGVDAALARAEAAARAAKPRG